MTHRSPKSQRKVDRIDEAVKRRKSRSKQIFKKSKPKKTGVTSTSKVTSVSFGGRSNDATPAQIAEAQRTGKSYYQGGRKFTPTNLKPATPRAGAAFERLAASRGVDLGAEQARATGQAERGETIGPGTSSTGGQSLVSLGQVPTGKNGSIIDLIKTDLAKGRAAIEGVAAGEDPFRELIQSGQLEMSMALSVLGGGGLITQILKGSKIGGSVLERVGQVGITNLPRILANTATGKIVMGALGKVFSIKALVYGGAWASAVFLGKWGQAEAPEPLNIVLNKYTIPDAIRTGDWSLVEEQQASRDELLDLEKWEEILLWSPFSPFVGIPNKIEGSIKGAVAQDQVIDDKRRQQEEGLTDEDMYRQSREERAANEQAITDYNNEQRLITEQAIQDLRREESIASDARRLTQVRKEIKLWEARDARAREQEEKDRIALADFWLEYHKQLQTINDNNRPSNLNFGLL